MTYAEMFKKMVIRQQYLGQAEVAANKLLVFKDRYEKVADILKCPWYFIALIHYRESAAHFDGVLHNGEKIIGTGAKTKLVPKNRGPFSTWEEAAIDALELRNIQKVDKWDLENLLEELEQWNGLGYKNYHPEIPTPYLWSGTTYYMKGKYAADGKFDPNLVDKQLGVAPILKFLDKTL